MPRKQRYRKSNLEIKQNAIFTTGDIAKIINVSCRTVSKWCDRGQLKSYRLPNSQDRRVERSELVKFLKLFGFPVFGLESQYNVILIDVDLFTQQKLGDHFEENWKLIPRGELFSAAMQISESFPSAIIMDSGLGLSLIKKFTEQVKVSLGKHHCQMVAIISEDENMDDYRGWGLSIVEKMPVDLKGLAEKIQKNQSDYENVINGKGKSADHKNRRPPLSLHGGNPTPITGAA